MKICLLFFFKKKTCKKTNGPTFFQPKFPYLWPGSLLSHHLGNPGSNMSWFPNHEKTILFMVGIIFFTWRYHPKKEKKHALNHPWASPNFFVKNLPETFPVESPILSSGLTWCFERCDSPNAWIPGVWPGCLRRNENPTTRRLRLLHPLTMIETCLTPPYQNAPKGGNLQKFP